MKLYDAGPRRRSTSRSAIALIKQITDIAADQFEVIGTASYGAATSASRRPA